MSYGRRRVKSIILFQYRQSQALSKVPSVKKEVKKAVEGYDLPLYIDPVELMFIPRLPRALTGRYCMAAAVSAQSPGLLRLSPQSRQGLTEDSVEVFYFAEL